MLVVDMKAVSLTLAFQDHAGDGLLRGMRKRKGNIVRLQPCSKICSLAMKLDRWPASGLACDLDVAPTNAAAPSRAQGLHAGLFRSKTGSVSFESVGFGIAVLNFLFCKDAPQEPFPESLNRFGDARHFGNVNSRASDHRDKVARHLTCRGERASSP